MASCVLPDGIKAKKTAIRNYTPGMAFFNGLSKTSSTKAIIVAYTADAASETVCPNIFREAPVFSETETKAASQSGYWTSLL
jgi:hypothetical protein